MRSPATTSWTWRPRPMFASALTSRSTPLWRSACSTRSRPPCRSPRPRSRRRNGRHPSLPVLRRLQCRSPALVPSTDRLISRPDPAVPGLRVAVGDPALDELASETAVPACAARIVCGRSVFLRERPHSAHLGLSRHSSCCGRQPVRCPEWLRELDGAEERRRHSRCCDSGGLLDRGPAGTTAERQTFCRWWCPA